MLGAHADHFMLAQMRERVTAITPNAGGQSLVVPDRERPGTAHVTVRGGYGLPGPQRTVSSSFVPGMGGVAAPPAAPSPRSMLPGMGYQDMLPGMGYQDMLPGMGIDASALVGGGTSQPAKPKFTIGFDIAAGTSIAAVVIGVAYLLLRKKK